MPAPSDDLEPTLRGVMTGVGDTALAYTRWEHPEPRGRVVISHGYGEHGGRWGHTARWLNREGWSVSAMDHRGFGRSGGIRGDANGIRGPVEDLTLFLRQERMHDAGKDLPQIVLGHSFGGLVALLALLWHPDTLEALIVSSPALKLRELPVSLKLLQKLCSWVIPHRPLDLPGDKSLVCSDPVMVQRYLDDPLCHRFVSAGFLAAMQEGWRELLGFGAELDRPILLLDAGQDRVTDPDGAEDLWSAVPQGLLQRHRLEGFYHEIFHDLRRAEAECLTGQWLDQLFPVAQNTPEPSPAMYE
ncbi:MAG: lysophospholipase [Holophaga sp.]|nr:lysophospholipase [Holophaga sp.]